LARFSALFHLARWDRNLVYDAPSKRVRAHVDKL